MRYRFQRHAWEQLQPTLLGKTLIFTDNHDWSDADLVRGYRAQHHVESAFRQMKDTDCIAIRLHYPLAIVSWYRSVRRASDWP